MKLIHLRLVSVLTLSILAGWVLVMNIKTSIVDFARVSNESMLPYLTPSRLLIIARFSPCLRLPLVGKPLWCTRCEPGHAYVFEDPRRTGKQLVKFAVEPETPVRRAAADRRGPAARDIIWFTQSGAAAVKPATAAHCRFEGSNREHSVDSRHFGEVPIERVLGRVIFPRVYYDARRGAAQP